MVRPLQRWLAAGTFGLACAAAHGQQTPELQRVLAKLGEAALELERSLPNFTCNETVVSQELREGKVRQGVTFTATMRAQRQADGTLAETFQITTLDGKAFTDGVLKAPVMVSGGFDRAMRYFHPEQQRCYDFSLSPGQIDFKSSAESLLQGCKEAGMAGFARLDADGEVTYLERTVPVETAKRLKLASYAEVTFAPVTMGQVTYRLSRHMVAERPEGRSIGRFEATYDHCRLFKSTATIGPAETLPDDSSASKK